MNDFCRALVGFYRPYRLVFELCLYSLTQSDIRNLLSHSVNFSGDLPPPVTGSKLLSLLEEVLGEI
jgi:hypothetical protein